MTSLPETPLLSPTGLCGDPGDGKAYLRWNLQIEDPRVNGWEVLQLSPERRELTSEPLTEPAFIAEGLENGTAYAFAVVGVLEDGSRTPESHPAIVTPREVGRATLAPLGEGDSLDVGQNEGIPLGKHAVKVTFPDGQELVYDRLRPVDWKTRDGEHLITPRHFGNGLDIGKFDDRGWESSSPRKGWRIRRSSTGMAMSGPCPKG